MEKRITELYCDRCRVKFTRRDGNGKTISDMDWWVNHNGIASRLPNQPLKDLCDVCTQQFLNWWGLGE